MSISDAKLAANRANALHSTGPNTDGGKAMSSQNATTHGLTGGPVVLPTESMNEFQRFSAEIVGSLEPETPVEREMARIVANLQWRLKRIKPIEDGLLNVDRFGSTDPSALPVSGRDCEEIADAFMNHGRSLANLSSYEHRLYRNMKDALNKVEALKAERERREEEEVQKERNREFKEFFGGGSFPLEADPVVEAQPATVRERVVSSAGGKACAALSPQDSDQGRKPLVSGFVFPKNEIAPETYRFSPFDRPEPSLPHEKFEQLGKREAA